MKIRCVGAERAPPVRRAEQARPLRPDVAAIAMTLPAPIEFRNVSFSRGGRDGGRILDGVTFTVGSGEVLVLVGRSGSGKTTILKMVNGLLRPTAGAVLVESRDTREWEPFALRRHAASVLQDVGLFPHMTVGQNAGIVARLVGWPAPRIERRVAELLDLVGLPARDFAARWPEELSGGQRQRVGVARALAVDPPILLMDEPFGALDPITRADMQAEFRRIQDAVHKTVVIVTHDMDEALALGDRLAIIDQGRLVACETARDIARSTDPRVTSLLGARGSAGAGDSRS